MWKTVVQACKLLKSLSKNIWGRSKESLLIYYFSLPYEGGENKIYQFFSLFLKILAEAGRVIILQISLGGRGSWHWSNVSVMLALWILFSNQFLYGLIASRKNWHNPSTGNSMYRKLHISGNHRWTRIVNLWMVLTVVSISMIERFLIMSY